MADKVDTLAFNGIITGCRRVKNIALRFKVYAAGFRINRICAAGNSLYNVQIAFAGY